MAPLQIQISAATDGDGRQVGSATSRTPLEYLLLTAGCSWSGTRGGAPQNPAWVHNLRMNSAARVEVGTESYDVVAHEITGDERDEIWARIIELCPRISKYPKPERVIPVFELRKPQSPLVRGGREATRHPL